MLKFADFVKKIKLRPHQDKAINKVVQNHGEGLFYHGLGSGKTITSIGAVEKLNSQRPLILTPAALQKNYKDTIHSTLTPNSQSKYNVMSYEKFRKRPEEYINKIKPDTVVVDEFHRQKDPRGVSFNSLKKIRPQVKNFIGLTATPVQNNPYEAIPLLNLVSNNKIPMTSQRDFEKKYIGKEKVYPKGILSGIVARLRGRYGERKVLKSPNKIKAMTAPYIDKNEPTPEFLSNFPKKEIVDIQAPMSKEQDKRYKYFMRKGLSFVDRWRIKHDLPPKAREAGPFFSRLTKLRQISNDISPLSSTLKDPLKYSGKINVAFKNLDKHLKSDPVNKAVVYSNFTRSGLDAMEYALKKHKIDYGVFSGDKRKKEKNTAITDYNAGKKKVLLVSPSGAEGLDLKGTTLQQVLDPNWNPAKMEQIMGRVARFKSHEALPPEKRKVRIERYSSIQKPGFFKRIFGMKPDTSIDQYIYHRAKEKQDLNDQINKVLGG